MKKNLLLLIFTFSISLFTASAQNAQIDSLRQVLKNYDAQKSASNDNHAVDKSGTIRVNILIQLSVQCGMISDYDVSKEYAEEALALAKQIGFKKGISDAYNIIGIIYNLTGNYPEALKNHFAALKIREEMGDLNGVADSYSNIGTIYENQGNFPEALKNHFASLKIKKTTGDNNGIASSYNNIGLIYFHQGNYPEALKNYFSSLKLSEKVKNKYIISASYHNIGTVYTYQSNYPEALKNYFAALKINEEAGNKNWAANNYSSIGVIYSKQGIYPKALKNHFAALNLYEEIGDKNGVAISYNNIGETDHLQSNYSEALKSHFAALKLYEEIGNKDGIATSYINIGDNKLELKAAAEAKDWLLKGLTLAKEIGSVDNLKVGYERLAAADSALGNFKSAYENQKLFILYRDSLNNEENTKKTTQMQMQYEFDKKQDSTKAVQEKKDAIAQKEMQKQKLVRNGFIGGFAVVLLFAGVFFTQRNRIKKGKQRSDELLLNILPEEVAEELKAKGSADAKHFDDVTVMFTDFKGFTQISEKLSPAELVNEIHECFKAFDNIIAKHNIEKIKTIGDSYMCAGGLPVANKSHADDVVKAAIEIQNFMQQHLIERKNSGKEIFEIRIGIHTGPVVAGIVGVKKFAYDIWGDTVNIASRMESSGEAGKINISGSTYELVKDKFNCEFRGEIEAKGKGKVKMYFINGKS